MLQPEGVGDGDCVCVTVGVREAVPQEEADRVPLPLGEKLPVEEELLLGETEPVTEGECVLQPEGDTDTLTVPEREAWPEGVTDGDCVPQLEGVCEPVPQADADRDAEALGVKLPLDVAQALAEAEPD